MPLGKTGFAAGKVHIQQKGWRAGLIYCTFTRPKPAPLLYFQNTRSTATNHQLLIKTPFGGVTERLCRK